VFDGYPCTDIGTVVPERNDSPTVLIRDAVVDGKCERHMLCASAVSVGIGRPIRITGAGEGAERPVWPVQAAVHASADTNTNTNQRPMDSRPSVKASHADCAVDALAQEVRVADVLRVLGDHPQHQPAQCVTAVTLHGADVGQVRGGDDRA